MPWRDQITVELLDHHGSDEAVANSARVSFAQFGDWNDLPEGYSVGRMAGLIKYLAEHRHLTPFRHNSMTIRCRAPLHMAAQLKKHQAGLSWNEVSRRYVKTSPELFQQEFRAAPEGSIKQGSAQVLDSTAVPILTVYDSDGTDQFVDIENIQQALLGWYDDCIAMGIAPETIRGYMPQNMMTEWVWTGNLLAFSHVFNERSASGAQKEVQVFADKLQDVLAPLFPLSWTALTTKKATE